MKIKGVIAEDFCNYKIPSMFIISSICDWKCCKEQGLDIGVCQNAPLISQPTADMPDDIIFELYRRSDISRAVVIGGLEPLLQEDEIYELIRYFRSHGETCPFIIYTGYYPEEVSGSLDILRDFGNIIVKFGRYIPNMKPVFDEVLGVSLASENQFAMEL